MSHKFTVFYASLFFTMCLLASSSSTKIKFMGYAIIAEYIYEVIIKTKKVMVHFFPAKPGVRITI